MQEKAELPLAERLSQPQNSQLKKDVDGWLNELNISPEALNSSLVVKAISIKAAQVGNLDVIRFLTEHKYIGPNSTDYIMHWAASRGHAHIVKYLIKYSNAMQIENVLCDAAKEGHFTIVQCLLENTQVDSAARNNSAIRLALEKGHVDVVLLLALQPSVVALMNFHKELGISGSLRKKVAELKKAIKMVLNQYTSNSCLFFQSAFDTNSSLSVLVKDVVFNTAGVGLSLVQQELHLSDKCMKNILSIRRDILSGYSEPTPEENTIKLT